MEKAINQEDLFALIHEINIFSKNIEEEGKAFNLNISLPNIAITFNNKLNSIIKQYRDHGMDFYSSSLLSPILNRMSSFMDYAMNTIQSFEKEEEKIMKGLFIKNKYQKCVNNINKFVHTYTAIDDQLYKFNIKNNITETILYDMLIQIDTPNNIYNNPIVFSLYEQELMSLGLEESVLPLRKTIEQAEKILDKEKGLKR